ncbi:non-ribosomal peptide synthetase [Pseudonocardia endophytica]|uniref:Phenyloxazoline synthase MbtB n=1 Tax=Pseudonocardia endophytica TaxID=401976 RepID=A0A4R1HSU1_PSEEN|nr:non-ribosomal peptide synthetase [Pseudonocardia endophytica]TCK25717.1 amino acid adenylation domain-containing protein [Pseudonocardia endophytica]
MDVQKTSLTLESVRCEVADVLGCAPDDLAPDEDLLLLGLDSVAMMRLAGRWRRAGVAVSFAEMAETPTLAAWSALLAGPNADSGPEPAGIEIDERAPFALTPVQHAYWVGRGDDQPLGGVGCHAYLEFDGAGVDPARLDAAVAGLVARHSQLRARFGDDGTQQLTDTGAWTGVTVHDLRDDADVDRALADVRERLSHRRLDVAAGQVFDVALSLLPGGATRVHLELDLLVADVLSLQILCRDLAALYADPAAALPPAGYGFARYLAERAARSGPQRERARAYWQERIGELPGGPQLPLAVDPDAVRRPRFTRRVHRVSAEDTARLVGLARAHDLTPAMVLATAYALTLAAWSAEPRFLLNLPLFDRQEIHPDVPNMVADFTNLVLVDVDTTPEAAATFVGAAHRVQSRMRANADHAGYSAIEVLRDLARNRPDERRTAPVVFASNIGSELLDARFRSAIGELGWMISQTPQVWLDHQLYEVDGGLMLTWDSVDALFPDGVPDAMFDAYRRLLARLLAGGWDRPLPALVPDAQLAVRAAVNATAGPCPDALLHDGFFARAAERPDRTALLHDGGMTTYSELAALALCVAGHLSHTGLAPGEPVAVTVPRGPGQIVAVLGILAAGGVYVPVGVDQPPARRERIHAAAGIRTVITPAVLDEARGARPLTAPLPVDPDALAYVIFTSGSTGEPKGVEITHRAAVNTIDDINRRFHIGPDDRVLAVSALDFDLSVYDVFGLLGAGGAVVLVDEADRRDPDVWNRACRTHGITVWNSVPALLDMLLVAAGDVPPTLRLAMVSGDWVPLDLPGRVRTASDGRCRLVALGGATEAAIWSNWFDTADQPPGWPSVPYGHPLTNQRFRVVDEHAHDCPDWVPGELWIGGTGVAQGYRGDPDRTADRFVTHDGHRWYRTGDLGRYHPDGTLEFLGRRDHQVKIRGHRIELGEIETALRDAPGVRAAAAAVTVGGGRRIAAALVLDGPPDPGGAGPEGSALDAVRAAARAALPGYMVPERWHVVDALPLTANGKVDRSQLDRVLAELDSAEPEVASLPPQGAAETAVADAWAAELNTAGIGRDADFFLLGGDSLIATRVVARLRADGVDGADLPTLFRRPVLADFAASLRTGTPDAERPPVLPADPEHRHEPFALTEVQRAYWLGRSTGLALGGVGTTYHVELDGDRVDVPGLERAFDRLIARHEMLRAVVDDDGRQRILPEVGPFTIPVAEADDAAAASARIEAQLARPLFDLTSWPLFAACAVHYPDGRTRLGVTLDYAVFDALSVKLVLAELAVLYTDPDAPLPSVGVSFRDYVENLPADTAAREADERWWRDRLPALPPAPRLPLATDPADVVAPRFTRRTITVPADAWSRIKDRARAHRLTPSAVLLAGYADVLAAFSGGRALSVNLTLFDRRAVHPDIDHVLGDFTSLLLVAHSPGDDPDWATTARRVQEQLAAGLEHRSVSAVWVQRELTRTVGQAEAAMPVVFTSTLGMDDDLFDRMPDGFPELVGGLSQTPQVWLDQQVMEQRGDLVVSWDAVEDLFPDGLLDTMFDAYRRLLDHLAERGWDAPAPAHLPASQRAVREAVNATGAPEPVGLLHDAIFHHAGAVPDRIALLWGDETVSYGELADRALRLAGHLRRTGVERGEPVAVTLPRGPGQVVAVLGILAAGGVYVPVGVDQPAARRERIHAAAGVRSVVTEALLKQTGEPLDAPVAVDRDALAYVIFTSGSTGEPKGVEITHRAALNTVVDINRRFHIGPDDRVLAVSALDFDLSVYDVFGLLGAGGAVVLVADEDRRDPDAWSRACRTHGVTVWNSVPALLDMLLVTATDLPPTLRLAMVSGDWVPLDLPARVRTAGGGRCRLVALGGATEAAIWSNWFDTADQPAGWPSVPYGHPLTNQRFRVVDERERDCPDWVPGELWIGGTGVAQGYRGDPGKTAERFVEHDGERWYRTGDLGRYHPDGTLEFLGRRDHQVKIRGHRIELGEIETALRDHPGVQDAVAGVDAERRRIVAAVVEAAAEPVTAPRFAEDAPVVDPARVVEAELTEALLARVLTRDLADGTEPPRAWRDWLVGRGAADLTDLAERADDARWAELSRRAAGTHLAPVAAALDARRVELAAIVGGEQDPRTLLDDPLLSPEAQAASRPETVTALGEIADRLTALAAFLDRPVRVVELGARTGTSAERLLTEVPGLDYVLTDPSAALLDAARTRLHGHRATAVALPDGVVPDDLRHRFDVVLAVGALHREADPVAAGRLVSLLLAPGGRLLAWEPAELAPLSLLTVPLLDDGAGSRSPLLSATEWAETLTAARLDAVEIAGRGPSLLMGALRPADRPVADPEVLGSWLTDRLPAHMVPDRIGVLASVPLSANGKVDRDRVLRLLGAGAPQPEFVAPRGRSEQAVAAIWADLLGVPRVSRDGDFFLLGGDSLIATRLVARLRGAGLTAGSSSGVLGRLFQNPVLSDFVAGLRAAEGTAPDRVLVPDPDRRHEPFDLSDVQQAYWLGRQAGFTLGAVGSHCYFEFDGRDVDPARIEEACNRLVARHDMLRTVVDPDGRQRVLRDVGRFTVPVVDRTGTDPAEAREALEALRAAMSHQVVDLGRWPLLDIRAVRHTGPDGAVRLRFGVSLDNFVFDGLSMMIFFAELSALYRDPDAALPPVGITFRDCVTGVETDPATREQAQRYWSERLATLPPAPKLPLAADPAGVTRPRFVRRETRLDAATWTAIKQRARENGLTPSVVLLTCYAQVLAAWSERQDVTVNLTLFDRHDVHPDVGHVIGDFTALLLVAHDPQPGATWLADATRLREQLGRDLAHRDVSAVAVQRELARVAGAADAAMPVVFTSALGLDDDLFDRAFDAPWQQVWGVSQTPQVWLDHQVMEQRGSLVLSWDAVDELFEPGVLDAMFDAYVGRLAWLAGGAWDSAAPQLVPPEQLAVRAAVNATDAPLPEGLLHEGFFAHAAARPDRPALFTDNGPVTYGELADRALRLAGHLVTGGLASGAPAAVTLPRGPDQVVAVLGILAAGGVYVPVGTDQPAHRRERIRAAAGVRTVVDRAVVDGSRSSEPLPAPVAVDRDALAYVIFTSGSTGEPKGVEITHRAALNTVVDINRRFHIGPDDRVLAVSALDFDLSVYDVFGLLGAGGALVPTTDDERRDPDAWLRACRTHGVTVWNSVPALLDMLLVTADALPPTLRLAMVSGDWVPLDLPDRVRTASAGRCRLIALGGATEAAIWSNWFDTAALQSGWTSVPYGRPLTNQRFRVVDTHGRDCPDHVLGELWIGGAGVAQGYRGDPGKTAERFVEHDGQRWYRTGDLGRYHPDGTLEFLGRRDHQVKIRGHRIELGEIETALAEHPGVAAAVAVAGGDRHHRTLAAFVVAGPELDPAALGPFLADRLPAYAVPAAFTVLDSLPLTSNGKVDRSRLTVDAAPAAEPVRSAPRGPVEELVAGAWADLLGVRTVGRDDDFFLLGGDSLVATRLVARLRAAGVGGVALNRLFEAPTLAGFCASLSTTGAVEERPAALALVADPERRHEPFPPTDVQRAYWLGRDEQFVLGGVGAHFYAELDGADVDVARLEQAWNGLIARHDMLRTVFDDDGRQRVLPDVGRFVIPVVDGGDEDLERLRDRMSHQVLDPSRWPLFDVRAVRYVDGGGQRRTRIGVGLDNLLVDALSIVAIYTELSRRYADPAVEPAPVEPTFRDYVLSVAPPPEVRERSEAWWRERIGTLPPAPRLPLAAEPAALPRPRFSRREARLGAERWATITERARAAGLTPSTVLMACYAEVLSAWSAQADLTLNLTLFDRRDVHPDIDRVLGDFTSLLLVPHRPRAGETWLERARRLQGEVWAGLEHRDVSAVWVQRELTKQTGDPDASMPVVFTSALGGHYELDDDLFGYADLVWGLTQTPQVWLDHQVVEYRGELVLNWDAVDDLFPDGMLDAMFAAYLGLLDRLDGDGWDAPAPELLPAAQAEVRRRVNATAHPEHPRPLHHDVFARATAAPERPALLGDGIEIAYGGLADAALRVAAVLRDSGVRDGDTVAVTVPRGPGQIVGVLGVLAAGGTYVPVGVDQPPARRDRIHAAAGVRTVVTEALLERARTRDPLDAPVPVDPDALAYVIFTSGSTGEPKGVEITHRAAVNTVDDVKRRFHIGSGDRVLAISALDFDLSVYDVFGLLGAGGAVVLVDEADRREARAWLRACRTHGVTVWNSVPALLDMLLVVAEELPPALRLALVSGDWVGLDLPGRLAAASGGRCRLISLGGATEAAIWSNHFDVADQPPGWTSVPYGHPLANQRFRVVDDLGRDCPDLVPGELWIGGTGVAQGYRGDPERTAERFVEHGGERWYRTGDLGRYHPDGTLEFLGRRDHQVKIRGHRIELGEIEAALAEHPGVAQVKAIAPGGRGDRRIAVVVVPADPGLATGDLPAFLADRLPAYALPSVYATADRLPLTPNGKVDARALAALVATDEVSDMDDPADGPAEEAVAAVWAEVLELPDPPGRGQNFFGLGGDSLAATRCVEILHRRYGVELSLRQLFTTPTVADTAAQLTADGAGAFESGSWEEGVV